MSETETLLPCPFCGERASGDGKTRYSEDFAKEQGWGQSEFYFCNCPCCGVNNQGLRGYETREEAIAAWNRRALPSRSDVLEEAAAKNDAMAKRLRLLARDLADYAKAHAEGGYEYLEQTAAVIRALKKDRDNG